MQIRGNNVTTNRRGLVFACLFVVIVSGVSWQLLDQQEPVYQGKPLSCWLTDFDSASVQSSQKAVVAVRAIGTNSFPVLKKMLRTTDPSWKKSLLAFNARQSLIQIRITAASVTRYRAVEGYSALGAAAKQEVAVLMDIMELEANAEVRSDVAAALGGIGPEAKPAIPLLMKAAQDQNQGLRHSAIFALVNIQGWSPSERFLPALERF
jgi:HEAT repeat protein